MSSVLALSTYGSRTTFNDESIICTSKVGYFEVSNLPNGDQWERNYRPYSISSCSVKAHSRQVCALPGVGDFFSEKNPTPLLDMIETPMHLKNLSSKELKQLADEIRSEISFILSTMRRPSKTSFSAVELTIAIHRVFHAPLDKILWDIGEQTYAHKMLTGRRYRMHKLKHRGGISGFTSKTESDYDAFGAGHGCNSVSAALGMAVARDLKGKREHIVAVISNWTTMAGQVYEAMGNAGYLNSNMVVILNDSRHSLHLSPRPEEVPKMSINAISSTLTKIQSSKSFRQFREVAKGVTKRIGKGIHEFAAKFDEYARGMIGPLGATLFEELGMYYVGPVDGHNIDDLICVLQEVASLDSTGPVLIHVITEENGEVEVSQNKKTSKQQEIYEHLRSDDGSRRMTYADCFVESLAAEAERDKDIVFVRAGMGIDPSLFLLESRFPDRYFDVGMAEQHAVTFAAGLSCGGLKPFCIIPSTFLQRAYDQIIQDVDLQNIPVRFAVTSAGLVGSDGPTNCGAFDIAFMGCLPNMIVMAPSDGEELISMVKTAVYINDRPVCFRYPRGAIVGNCGRISSGSPLQVGKGRILAQGTDVALLGYGVMVQNCLKARSLLSNLGVQVTVADARFCKPLDIELVRQLCKSHEYLVTVEEGTVGGFGSHVAQFIALDGLLDGKVKWRPIILPDSYIEHASLREQLEIAGLTGHHIAATALSLLGRARDALLLTR